ncbi:MAG: response regulator [Candidatus Wildermuthbacteria bacterium]|nr:response regulator [Candidatus Wildermuthbacteria bacterium]
MKILLVEDDPLLIDIYTTKFREVGYEVALADAGDKVAGELEKSRPDLVILDIVLPHQNGFEVLADLKKDPRWKDLKVIMLSNLGQKEDIEKALQLGAAMYLIKAHYTPSQIVQEIQKLFI